MPKFVLLWTDVVIWLLFFTMLGYGWLVSKSPTWRVSWGKVFRDAPALASAVIVVICLVLTLVDSIHYRRALAPGAGAAAGSLAYEPRTRSALTRALGEKHYITQRFIKTK